MQFAKTFHGIQNVSAVYLPGFLEGELLPASLDIAIEALAKVVRRPNTEAPFVLVGHSSGGLIAYAVASHLERIGVFPTGVIMIDTYPFEGSASADVLRCVLDGILEREGTYVSASDVRLTAMGAYLRLLAEWHPVKIAAPTVLLRAAEPMVGLNTDQEWKTSLSFPHTTIDVPGNHFTMMEDHAVSTGQAVQAWLLRITGALA